MWYSEESLSELQGAVDIGGPSTNHAFCHRDDFREVPDRRTKLVLHITEEKVAAVGSKSA